MIRRRVGVAIEFIGPIGLAAIGMRTRRNLAGLAFAAAGVFVLTDVRIAHEPVGYLFAFANCALFVLYIVLGHRIASAGQGIDRLGAAMLVAMIAALPIGIADAAPAFTESSCSSPGLGLACPPPSSLCLRSARDGAPSARGIRPAAGATPRHRLCCRIGGAAPGPHPTRAP
jgi:threonine/homoserine efflux transporter RhtA